MIIILHRSQVLQLRTVQINWTSSKAVLVALPANSAFVVGLIKWQKIEHLVPPQTNLHPPSGCSGTFP